MNEQVVLRTSGGDTRVPALRKCGTAWQSRWLRESSGSGWRLYLRHSSWGTGGHSQDHIHRGWFREGTQGSEATLNCPLLGLTELGRARVPAVSGLAFCIVLCKDPASSDPGQDTQASLWAPQGL
jgi:hypothetical protein